jgi:hypothetical protein
LSGLKEKTSFNGVVDLDESRDGDEDHDRDVEHREEVVEPEQK